MRDILPALVEEWRSGATVGLATVIATWSSAPRPVGAALLVTSAGTVAGSVSGGCVEGALYDVAQTVAESGRPVLERYGVADDDAFAVGLMCGGSIELFVEPIDATRWPGLGDVLEDVAAGRPVAVATVVDDERADVLGLHLVVRLDDDGAPVVAGRWPDENLQAAVTRDAVALLAHGGSSTRGYGAHGELMRSETRVLVHAFRAPPRMLVFGAIDFAAALAAQAALLGYQVSVCDARPVFATRERFPAAHEVIVDWPHRYLAAQARAGALDPRAVVMVLTHDPKFDVPVLEVALGLDLAFIGAMGSRRTHADRLERLREAGVGETSLEALASPLGLDLGAQTPQETAVSIMGEVIARARGGSGLPLRDVAGPIHHRQPSTSAAGR